MGFARFMSSPAGRALRIVAGIALIALAAALGGWWWLLGVFGVVALVAGATDVCVFAPIFGGPFRGRDVPAA